MSLADRMINRLISEVVNETVTQGFKTANNYLETQRVLADERQKNKALYSQNILLARLAVAYYIARANGTLADGERAELGRMTNQILHGVGVPTTRLQEGVKAINSYDGDSFVFYEKYMQPITNGDLASFITIGEQIAMADGDVTPEEEEALKKLRDYVSDRTGKDFTTNDLDDQDLVCQGCGGHMDISDGGGMLVCPFCGMTRVINERKLYSELREYNFGGVSVGDDFFDVLDVRLSRGEKISAIQFACGKLGLPIGDVKGLVESYEVDMDRTKYDAKFRGQGRPCNN